MRLDPRKSRALDAVLARSAQDRDFRRRLLTDPRGAIHDSFGITIPRGFHIKFIEREPGVDALVVLPAIESADDEELSDEELETIAGDTEGEQFGWSDPDPPRRTGHRERGPPRAGPVPSRDSLGGARLVTGGGVMEATHRSTPLGPLVPCADARRDPDELTDEELEVVVGGLARRLDGTPALDPPVNMPASAVDRPAVSAPFGATLGSPLGATPRVAGLTV